MPWLLLVFRSALLFPVQERSCAPPGLLPDPQRRTNSSLRCSFGLGLGYTNTFWSYDNIIPFAHASLQHFIITQQLCHRGHVSGRLVLESLAFSSSAFSTYRGSALKLTTRSYTLSNGAPSTASTVTGRGDQ
ncbi:hypothetical protein BKA81DRAFT_30960 [Phyllosticta paracitricarpa]